jgi:hypothetical protein
VFVALPAMLERQKPCCAKPEVRSRCILESSHFAQQCTTVSLMPGKWTVRLESLASLHRRSAQAQRRLNWTNARNSITGDLGPTREDAHQTFRVRKDQKGKDLPLPPLLDPVITAKRSRWETTKALPKHADATPFQKKLLSNSNGKSVVLI